jgi:hypothetical protein
MAYPSKIKQENKKLRFLMEDEFFINKLYEA